MLDGEGDVQVAGERVLVIDRLDPEVSPLHPLALDGWKAERLVIEGAAGGGVGNRDVDVVKHHAHDHRPGPGLAELNRGYLRSTQRNGV